MRTELISDSFQINFVGSIESIIVLAILINFINAGIHQYVLVNSSTDEVK